jgi:hypothetical protein
MARRGGGDKTINKWHGIKEKKEGVSDEYTKEIISLLD